MTFFSKSITYIIKITVKSAKICTIKIVILILHRFLGFMWYFAHKNLNNMNKQHKNINKIHFI